MTDTKKNDATETETSEEPEASKDQTPKPQKEIGGRGGADPTRFGDWEINGRCVDF